MEKLQFLVKENAAMLIPYAGNGFVFRYMATASGSTERGGTKTLNPYKLEIGC
jgi:hypothetical protein